VSRTIQFVATDPEPGSNYTPAYRQFFARLRRARIDKGLSLFEVAELVGLELPLAYEVENLIAPLPFEWLEVWCKVVGVPFADYLVVYWASEEAYFQKLECEAEEKAARERGDTPNAPCITNTEADATLIESLSRGCTWLTTLRAAFDRIARFFRSRFSNPQK
jgi:transcriptional regulator with XRE-family HTH domain